MVHSFPGLLVEFRAVALFLLETPTGGGEVDVGATLELTGNDWIQLGPTIGSWPTGLRSESELRVSHSESI